MLRMLSLCSGIGGADLAAEWTHDIEIVGQVEIDPFCQSVLAKHWPHVKRLRDIKEVRGDEFGAIDIVVGGIPCQPFSSAGKQTGTGDDRYLWPEMFRIVRCAQPAWVVIENVDDFTYMALDIVQADLEREGYACQAFVFPACAVGAPHVRERCFVVAHSRLLGDGRPSGTLSTGQCSSFESAGSAGRKDSASLAHTSSTGRQECDTATIAGEQGYTARRNLAPGVANAQHRGRERRVFNTHQPDATVLYGSSATGTEPQSRMGRMLDGLSARLDSHRWPALPGQEQQEWEPSRTVTGRQPYRNQRLKALGNAIVPQQIYPIFQLIVEASQ